MDIYKNNSGKNDKINLYKLKLKTFTEQDALDYCLLNNLNPDNIKELILGYNYLTDISNIKLFKNLEYLNIEYNKITDISVLRDLKNLEILYIDNNKIKNISVIKYLTELKYLGIINLKLESDQIQYIKSLKNLKRLFCYKGFKDISVLNQINKNIEKSY